MSDILDLEQRLTVALRRISTAIETFPKASKVADPSSSLGSSGSVSQNADAEALSEVRSRLTAATAKLTVQEEKIKVLGQALEENRTNRASSSCVKNTQNNMLASAFSELEVKLSQLSQSNTQLREANQSLRDANAKRLGDVGIINSSLQSEIDTLSAERATDIAQLHFLIAALAESTLIDDTEDKENA